jgi:putative tricarboxylic transport membrane protein
MFGPAETFAFALFGLSIIVSLSSDSLINGLISGFLGLLIATVGFAPSGALRFVYTPELIDGFPVIIVLIGLFTIPEVMDLIERQRLTIAKNSSDDVSSKRSNFLLKLSDWRSFGFNFLRSSGIGSFVGILPGAGPTIAGFVSYNEARRASKNPTAFGKGEIDGVIAADTANNAAVLSSLVPALTLGIPGSVDAVIILAALTMHGLLPGPMLFERNADLVYAVFMGVFVANFIMLIVGSISARHIAKITRVRVSILSPIILVFAIVGAFAVRNNWFDVFLAIIIGLIGYGLKRMNIPLAPLVLGAILGPILERNLYQMVVSYSGRINELIIRPIFIVFILLSILSILVPILRSKRG